MNENNEAEVHLKLLSRFGIAILAAACAAPAPPPAAAPPPPVQLEPFPYAFAWTRVAGVSLSVRGETGQNDGIRSDGSEIEGSQLLHLFTRLDVIERDSSGLRVTCPVCDPVVTGHVSEEEIVTEVLPPEVAAWGELSEFLLSIRAAATRRDLAALLPVMAPDFTYDFIGIQTPEAAFDVWRAEQFRSLDEVPSLLDQGVTTDDLRIWSSPPEFLSSPIYDDLRLGFRQQPSGRWEWLFLIRGIG